MLFDWFPTSLAPFFERDAKKTRFWGKLPPQIRRTPSCDRRQATDMRQSGKISWRVLADIVIHKKRHREKRPRVGRWTCFTNPYARIAAYLSFPHTAVRSQAVSVDCCLSLSLSLFMCGNLRKRCKGVRCGFTDRETNGFNGPREARAHSLGRGSLAETFNFLFLSPNWGKEETIQRRK